MAVDVEELFLQPFQEIVERAREAIDNAEEHGLAQGHGVEVMLAAAQSLMREGERAIKKLRPLWISQLQKYGEAFKSALLKQDVLDEKRSVLQDLMYDFEDFVTIDTFDAPRFAQVQAACRSLALGSIEAIRRLKIDVPSGMAKSAFPPLPPLPPTASRPSSRASNLSGLSRRSPNPTPPTTQVANVMQSVSSQVAERSLSTGVVSHPPGRALSGTSHASSSSSPAPLRSSPPTSSGDLRLLRTTSRYQDTTRPVIPAALSRTNTTRSRISDADTLPPYSLESHSVPALPPMNPRRYSGSQTQVVGTASATTHRRSTSSVSISRTETESSMGDIPDFPIPRTRTTAWVSDQLYTTSPHESDHTTGSAVITSTSREQHALDSVQHMTLAAQRTRSVSPGLTDDRSHYTVNFDTPSSPVLSTLDYLTIGPSPVSSSLRAGTTTWSRVTSDSTLKDSSAAPSLTVRQTTISEEDEIRSISSSHLVAQPSEGNFPSSMSSLSALQSTEGCCITIRSSLHAMHGFCAGAQAYKNSGAEAGIKRLAGHVAGTSTAITRCASCSYGHSSEETELDRNQSPKATFAREHGVLFRIRFLYKSHLPATRTSEAYYGCLFCAKNGSTTNEQDATVFKDSDELLKHLAHHSQPLPEVQGLTVLYGKQILKDDTRVNNFDLWLTEAALDGNGMPDQVVEYVEQLPRATATKSHVQRYGEKKLARPDGTSVNLCEFFIGARIVGVEYPLRHGGKWCTGWHNGSWGYFPSKSIELEMPRRDHMPPILAGIDTSGFVVTTKWKWELAKDNADKDKAWLTFNKGDKITNVAWVGQETLMTVTSPHKSDTMSNMSSVNGAFAKGWCWSGTNSRGKFGLFPQSHIDNSTLREEASCKPLIPPKQRPKEVQGRKGFFGTNKKRPSVSEISSTSGISVVEII